MRASPCSHPTSHSDASRCMADMAELTNRACLVAGDLNSRPPRPPDDPRRPSHQLGRAPHELDGRACVRPTCTMWCARVRMCVTVGSRRKCARRVLRRIVDPRGQNPSVESMCRVPGQWHRQWTALDLPLACVNMSLFCGATKHGLGVKARRGSGVSMSTFVHGHHECSCPEAI